MIITTAKNALPTMKNVILFIEIFARVFCIFGRGIICVPGKNYSCNCLNGEGFWVMG